MSYVKLGRLTVYAATVVVTTDGNLLIRIPILPNLYLESMDEDMIEKEINKTCTGIITVIGDEQVIEQQILGYTKVVSVTKFSYLLHSIGEDDHIDVVLGMGDMQEQMNVIYKVLYDMIWKDIEYCKGE